MLRNSRAGAAALLAAPAAAILSAIVQPTLSDDPAQQLRALTHHRAAAIASLTLNTVAIALLIAGVIWLALAISQRAPRLATAGGSLAVLGSLIVLFENGIAAAAPSAVRGLHPAAATAALERTHSSVVVSGLEPLSLLGDVGLAVLGVAVLAAGAPRLTAAIIVAGAFGEGIGFATATRALVIASFAILLLGLVQAVPSLLASPTTYGSLPTKRPDRAGWAWGNGPRTRKLDTRRDAFGKKLPGATPGDACSGTSRAPRSPVAGLDTGSHGERDSQLGETPFERGKVT